jgi:microsomal dipeptidase-like Zn-dependent dipeptidase
VCQVTLFFAILKVSPYAEGMQLFHLVFAALFMNSVSLAAQTKPEPVRGFADLHNHMFTEYAFGGGWLHGSVEGEIQKALASCETHFDPLSLLGDHARVSIPLVSRFIGKTAGSSGDTGTHNARHEGYPNFGGWPRWDTIAHQQMWEGHLRSAHDHGLNLMLVSLVNFEPLCELIPEKNKKYQDCSDTAAVERQLDAVEAFEKNHDWFVVVKTPEEARDAIKKGKLAIILSIETSHLFGDGDWRPEFDHVYKRRVRTLQIAHQLDNRFAGVALHNAAFRFFAWWNDFKKNGKWWQILTPSRFGFQYDEQPATGTKLNRKGLTSEGTAILTEMMKKGMPIDLAHLSEQTVRDIQAITEKNQNYPVYVSHGHLREAMDDGKFSVWEKSSPGWILDYIKKSGGLFGLRTGPEKTKAFEGSTTPNDCFGSSKSFAQTYQFGRARGLSIAFGSDLNGFIQQTRPRFGNAEETCGAETDAALRKIQQERQTGPLHKRFDQSGYGEISQLPDLMTELQNFGVKTDALESSAEAYLKMWERATEASSQINAAPI